MQELHKTLKSIVSFRGRYAFPKGYVDENIIPKFEFNRGDMSIKTREAQYTSYGSYPILECKIGKDRYFTYKSPTDKGWNEAILNIYLMEEEYKTDRYPLEQRNFEWGKIEEKEKLLGIKAITSFQLSKILKKELTDRGLYDEFKFACEEAVLKNV